MFHEHAPEMRPRVGTCGLGARMESDRNKIRLGALEMAAVYMRSNALSTPIVSLAIAWVLTNWVAPLWPIAWAALSTLAAIATAVVNHAFLNDPQREKYLTQWSGAIEAVAFLGSFTFALSGLCFYIPGERLNNILLMSVLVACIASVAAMAAPRLRLAVFSAGPHAAALVATKEHV